VKCASVQDVAYLVRGKPMLSSMAEHRYRQARKVNCVILQSWAEKGC